MNTDFILPHKIYSAGKLYWATGGQPFGWCFKKWKKELFFNGSGLKFTKGRKKNSAYRVKGSDFVAFVSDPKNLRKFV